MLALLKFARAMPNFMEADLSFKFIWKEIKY